MCCGTQRKDMMTGSGPTAQGSDPYADRRIYPRVTVALPAFLQADGDRHAVQIVDLSSGGARLTCSQQTFRWGTAGDIGLRNARPRGGGQGRLNEGFMGLSFDKNSNIREVSALTDRSSALGARMKTRG